MLAPLLQQRPETASAKEGWQPLWYLVLEITQKYLKDTTGCDADEDEVLALLQTKKLSGDTGRALYAHLSTKLRGTAVRIVLGSEVRGYGISYLDFRCPKDISHPDSDNANQMITCFRAVSRHSYQLLQPLLPCIAVLMTGWKRQYRDNPQKWYRTYPLECCWYKPADCLTYPGDGDWPPVSSSALPAACQLRIPPWVAQALTESDANRDSSLQHPAADLAPVGSTDSTSSGAAGRLSGTSSRADSPGSGVSSATAYVGDDNADAALEPKYILRNAFGAISQQLLPTKDEDVKMKKAVKGVHDVVVDAARGKPWKLMAAQPVGSFECNTSLRGSYDLDLQLMLNVDEEDPDNFTAVRQQCLSDLCSALCGKPRKGTDPEKIQGVT